MQLLQFLGFFLGSSHLCTVRFAIKTGTVMITTFKKTPYSGLFLGCFINKS